MISIKNAAQLDIMRDSGKILYDALHETISHIKPGVSTLYLDSIADAYIRKYGGIPAFKDYNGFPNALCTSVNDTVVHGIPKDSEVLKEGDIISLDCGVLLSGMYTDSAITVGVGHISKEAEKLIKTTEESFFAAAKIACAGVRLGDVGYAVSKVARRENYGVVRALTGHGIGKNLHEDPPVYNYGVVGKGPRLYKNMTICIEPMINSGTWDVMLLDDDWTIKTTDASLSSHYEHTLLINEGLPELITFPGFKWEEA